MFLFTCTMATNSRSALSEGSVFCADGATHPFDIIIKRVLLYNTSVGKPRAHKVERRKKERLRIVCSGFDVKRRCECKFVLNASLNVEGIAKVGKIDLNHTCTGEGDRERGVRGDLALSIAPVTASSFIPTGGIKGGDTEQLRAMMERESGYKPSYRVCSQIVRERKGDDNIQAVGQFRYLESYIKQLQTCDPSGHYDVSVAQVGTIREFQRLYVAPSATISFWKHARRCGATDGTHCHTIVKGMLLLFAVQDANNQLMVLAFCFTESEDRAGYDYFFQHVAKDFPGNTIIIGDGDKGMKHSMLEFWKSATLSRCVRHYIKNYHTDNAKDKIHRPHVTSRIYASARTTTTAAWEHHLTNIRSEEVGGEAIATWLESIRGSVQAQHFNSIGLRRYGETVNNNAEQMNNVFIDLRGLPVLSLVKGILSWIGKKFFMRHQEAVQWASESRIFTPAAEKQISICRQRALSYEARLIDLSMERVEGICQTGMLSYNIVITKEEGVHCPCRKSLDTGMPCAHAFSIFAEIESKCRVVGEQKSMSEEERSKLIALANEWQAVNPLYYDPSVYLVESYLKQYGSHCKGVTVDKLEEKNLIPWHVLSKSGKKRKMRFTTAPKKTSYKCNLCGSMGHNSASCTRPSREKILDDVKRYEGKNHTILKCVGTDEDHDFKKYSECIDLSKK